MRTRHSLVGSGAEVWRSGLVLCLLAAVCGAVTPDNDDRIVGGEPVDISQFPWQVSLEEYQDGYHKHFCGGSIIGSTWVLTAAHCNWLRTPQELYVRAGSSKRGTGGIVYNVATIIQHEDHDNRTFDYHFGLLEISESIDFGSVIQAVNLGSSEIDSGTKVTVSGWGRTAAQGDKPWQLHAVTTTVVDRDACNKAYADSVRNITERMICAGEEEGGKDACVGDSGGALVADSTQYGVVSWRRSCAEPGYPSVYSNVPVVRGWITEKTGI